MSHQRTARSEARPAPEVVADPAPHLRVVGEELQGSPSPVGELQARVAASFEHGGVDRALAEPVVRKWPAARRLAVLVGATVASWALVSGVIALLR